MGESHTQACKLASGRETLLMGTAVSRNDDEPASPPERVNYLQLLPESLLQGGPLPFLTAGELGRCALVCVAFRRTTAAAEDGSDDAAISSLWAGILQRAALLPLPPLPAGGWVLAAAQSDDSSSAAATEAAAIGAAAATAITTMTAADWRAAVSVAGDSLRCTLCGGAWGWKGRPPREGPSRCPCIVRRSLSLCAAAAQRARAVRLVVGFFEPRRCREAQTGACFGGDGFRSARTVLGRRFDLVLRPMASLLELEAHEDSVQLLFADTWSCGGLAPPERAALQGWVARGGSLVANVFCNWQVGDGTGMTGDDDETSLLALFAGGTMTATVGSALLPSHRPPTSVWPNMATQWPPMLKPQHVASTCCGTAEGAAKAAHELRLLLRGPFGECHTWPNRVETDFAVPHRAACAEGVLPLSLASRAAELGRDAVHRCTVAYLPPAPDRAVRAGRVLIVTNNHWMADPGHWHGGLLHTDSNNALLLNLAALAATQDWRDACM